MASYISSNTYFKNIRDTKRKLQNAIKDIDKCDIPSHIKSYKPIDKSSASSTLIVLGQLSDEITRDIEKDEDKQFVIKASFENKNILDNSLQVERQIYNNIIGKMLNNNMTPCLIDKITSFECNKQELPEFYSKLYNDIDRMGELKSFDDYIINILMLEKTSGVTLFEFLQTLKLDSDKITIDEIDLVTITFQLLWTLSVFEKLRFKHNDLHFNNIFVEITDEPVYMLFLINGNEYYRLETNHIIKIYDFDRSSVYSYPGIDRNIALDTDFCKYYGQCNYMSSKFDLFTCLHQFLRFLPSCNFNDIFLLKCFDKSKPGVKTNHSYGHLLPFGETDKQNFIKSPIECLNVLSDTNWGVNNPISKVILKDEEKNNYKYCTFTLPEKIQVKLWNPISREDNKSITEDFDTISKEDLNIIVIDMLNLLKSEFFKLKEVHVWKFELSLIKNFDWVETSKILFFEYTDKKFNMIEEDSIYFLLIACLFLSCPIYYKINNYKYMNSFIEDYDDIKKYMADIWNTFNNVLPVQIPLL